MLHDRSITRISNSTGDTDVPILPTMRFPLAFIYWRVSSDWLHCAA